jgi:nitroreductase
MNVFTAITHRKSVRAYKDIIVEREKIRKVLDAARLSPSADNRQEWKFIIVTDNQTKAKLAGTTLGQPFLAQTPVIIVACATQTDHIMLCGQSAYTMDVAIACAYMTLQATELGLGTCLVSAFREYEVKTILNIPEHYRVVSMMPMGYPDQPRAMKLRKSLDQIVCFERYE